MTHGKPSPTKGSWFFVRCPMITLYGTGPAFGLPHASPFAIKVEMLLKIAALPYRLASADIRKAPRGKIPWIEGAGEVVADSRLIKLHLETRHGADFSGGHGPRELGCGLAVERMLENHLYWFAVENRWLEPENFARGPVNFFKAAPGVLRPLIIRSVLKKTRRDAATQGQNRLSAEEKLVLVGQALQAMADILGDRPYLLGDRVSGADATAFAFLATLESPHFDTPYGAAMRGHPGLMAYIGRIRAEFFPT